MAEALGLAVHLQSLGVELALDAMLPEPRGKAASNSMPLPGSSGFLPPCSIVEVWPKAVDTYTPLTTIEYLPIIVNDCSL